MSSQVAMPASCRACSMIRSDCSREDRADSSLFFPPLNPRQDEVPGLLIFEEHETPTQSTSQKHPVGVLHKVSEKGKVLAGALHDCVLRVLGLTHPALAGTPD